MACVPIVPFAVLRRRSERDRLEPELVGAGRFGRAKIVTAACGGEHTAAVTEEGAHYT